MSMSRIYYIKELLKQGDEKFYEGQYKQGINIFQKVVELEPHNSEAWCTLGFVYSWLDQDQEAIDVYNQALQIQPDYILALARRGQCYQSIDQSELAMFDFELAISIEPLVAEDWYGKGIAFWELNKEREALKALDNAIELDPEKPYFYNFQGSRLFELERFDEAIIVFDKALKICPQYSHCWYCRGMALFRIENYEEAIASFGKAIEIKSDDSSAWTGQGNCLQSLSRYEEAITSFDRAIEIDSSDYYSLVNRAYCLQYLSRYEEAIISFDRAIEIKSDDSIDWINKGNCLQNLSHYEEAIISFDKAIEIKSDDSIAWRNKGICLQRLFRYEEAITSFDRTIGIDSNDSSAWRDKGICLQCTSRYEEAITVFDKAIKIDSSDYCSLVNRAYCLQNLSRYEEVISAFNKVLEIKSDDSSAWRDKGICLQSLSRYEEAIASFDKAIEIDSSDYYSLVNRAYCLQSLSHYEEAISAFNKVLEIKPDDSSAWTEQGNCLQSLSRYEDAIYSYDAYLALSQDKDDWLILTHRGRALAKLSRYTEAEVSFRKAIQIKRDEHFPWHKLGETLHSIGQLDESLNAYQESLKYDSQCEEALEQQGYILGELCHYYESLESFNHAITVDSKPPGFHNGRGLALNALGRYTEALAAYNQALQNDAQFWPAWLNRGWTIYYSRGLDEALKAWDETLLKLKPEHPNYAMVCAELQYIKGRAHYNQGKKQADGFSNWRKAKNYYLTALKLLDPPDHREEYLDILQDLVKVLVSLRENNEAIELGRRGTTLLQRLLSETVDLLKQQQVSLKYASFDQLTIDSYVQSGQLVKALEMAEIGKNTCLSWLFSACNSETNNLQQQLWQMLNPSTALVYWHLSPASLTTFILTSDTQIPAILHDDYLETNKEEREELAQSHQQLLKFETWMNNWNWLYAEYGKAPDKTARENHSWRVQMPEKLEQLKQILKIPKIVDQLPSSVNQIILVPHQSLHCFPLHALFPDRFTLTYLPSIQMGLTLKARTLPGVKLTTNSTFRLLSLEAPNSTGEKQKKKFERLGFAALESKLISQMFQTTTIQSHEANQQKVREMLQQSHDWFHFAGHAAYNFNDPKTSALALTGEDRLTVVDICGETPLVQGYSLVCLSACETALTGDQTITAEYVGLVSGFLRGGANKIVSTLWTVQSVSSTLLMIQFYSLLKNGTPEAVALGEAQRWLRDANCQILIEFLHTLLATYTSLNRSTRKFLQTEINRFSKMPHDNRPFHHPYHWAGFTLTGLPPL
jgi:tetratricopeptide (TPR) repeat protein/CHAT domain-containing protein